MSVQEPAQNVNHDLAKRVTARPTRFQYSLADLLTGIVMLGLGLILLEVFRKLFPRVLDAGLLLVSINIVTLCAVLSAMYILNYRDVRSWIRTLVIFVGVTGTWLIIIGGWWLMDNGFLALQAWVPACFIVPSLCWSLIAWHSASKVPMSRWRAAALQFVVWLPLTMLFGMVYRGTCNRARNGNEGAAIAACKTYAGAQDIYRRIDYDGDGVLEYATSISGANSLYERHTSQGDLTLVDQAFARASLPPGHPDQSTFAGYYFKILTGQEPHARGGEKSYLVQGNMTLGYGIVAWPEKWDETGLCTFIFSKSGKVYEKNLGPNTTSIVESMTAYDPGPGWEVAE